MEKSTSILVLGAGPAGSAAAIFLARKGFQITIVERGTVSTVLPSSSFKIGESLPPTAKVLLEHLDVWPEFEKANHLKCYGNQSFWGNETAGFTDFITQPPGYGWHLDRPVFEQMLLLKAQSQGVTILEQTKLKNAQFQAHRWTVDWVNKKEETEQQSFDFIVDASGRNSWLARRQGVDRMYENRQLALIAFLQSSESSSEASSLIETTSQGWWYSANIPSGRMATAFLCKPDKGQRNQWLTKEGWWNLLQQAPHTLQRIQSSKSQWMQTPQFVAADSGILERTYGQGWLAVGDAAMTYDPVASHGMMMAMVSARDAAQAIAEFSQGKKEALEQYDHRLSSAYYEYVKQRSTFYKAEKRFADAEYWS